MYYKKALVRMKERDVHGRFLGDVSTLVRAREQKVQTVTVLSKPSGNYPVSPVSVAIATLKRWMGQRLTLKTMSLRMRRSKRTNGGEAHHQAGRMGQHRGHPDVAEKMVGANPPNSPSPAMVIKRSSLQKGKCQWKTNQQSLAMVVV